MNDDRDFRELDDLDSPLAAAVNAALADDVPEDAVARVAARAKQLGASAAAAKTTDNQITLTPAASSNARSSRSWRGGLMLAAALAAVAVGVAIFDGSGGGGRAFARMIDKVRAAASARFETTVSLNRGPANNGRMYLEEGRCRFEQFDGTLVVVADAKEDDALVLDTTGKRAQKVDASGFRKQGFFDPIEQLRQVKTDDAMPMGAKVLNGRRTHVFRVPKIFLLGIEGDFESLVWVDAESDLPAKIVIRDVDPKHPAEFRFENFVWNDPADPNLFALDVPDGYQVAEVMLTTNPREADVPEVGESPTIVDGVIRDRVAARIVWSTDGATVTALMRDPEKQSTGGHREHQLRQWDVANGQLRWSQKVAGAGDFAVTPDGTEFATVMGFEVQIRSASTGEVLRRWETKQRLSSLAFSPDGKTLAGGIGEWGRFGGDGGEPRGGIELWDVAAKSLVRTIEDDAPTTFVSYSADGHVASSSNDGPVKLWDAASGELVRMFPGRRAAFATGGDVIACVSTEATSDKGVGRVDLLSIIDGQLRKTLTTESAAESSYLLGVAFSRDGSRVAAVDWNGAVTVWDAATGNRIATSAKHDGGVISLAFSPDGKTLATGSEDRTLRFWKLDDGATK